MMLSRWNSRHGVHQRHHEDIEEWQRPELCSIIAPRKVESRDDRMGRAK